jgi:MFS family permease
MTSYLYLRVLIEPGSESVDSSVEYSMSILAQARIILGRDKNFRNFLVVDAFTLMSMTASVFYSVHAIEKFGLPPSYAGTFTVIVMASMAAGNIAFGYLADSFGHKMNLILLAGASVAASFVALVAGNILVYGFAFFFMALTLGLQGISRLSFVAEMCSEADRPTYIALTNTLTAPTVAVGTLFGWIARVYGFETVFGMGMLFGLFALVRMHMTVPDPRVHPVGEIRRDQR